MLYLIQDELIITMGNKIRKTVPGMIKNSKCYLVLFGLTYDICHQEHIQNALQPGDAL
jgi:hypothetical protein